MSQTLVTNPFHEFEYWSNRCKFCGEPWKTLWIGGGAHTPKAPSNFPANGSEVCPKKKEILAQQLQERIDLDAFL